MIWSSIMKSIIPKCQPCCCLLSHVSITWTCGFTRPRVVSVQEDHSRTRFKRTYIYVIRVWGIDYYLLRWRWPRGRVSGVVSTHSLHHSFSLSLYLTLSLSLTRKLLLNRLRRRCVIIVVI